MRNDGEDPLVRCRQAGAGRVQLAECFNIWIDMTELTLIYRWKKNPKEMARRLLKLLVGEQNLVNMSARGKSSTRQPVPEDILNCVECNNIFD